MNPAAGIVLAVCGLVAEERLVAGPGIRTLASGGRIDTLAARIAASLDGVAGLVSVGVAGALEPSLRPGHLLVASRVVDRDATYDADPAWLAALARRLSVRPVVVAGGDRIVATREEKRALGASTGAAAVDMESHVVARIAQEHGLPFAVLRAITDPAETTLPSAARLAMRPDGGIDGFGVFRSILREPGQLPALIRLGRDQAKALDALRDGLDALRGLRIGHADLDQLPLDVV